MDPLFDHRGQDLIDQETKRRKFMQVHNRWLEWGFIPHPSLFTVTGVVCRVETTPYHWEVFSEAYADHADDRDATERAVIDKAMLFINAIDEVFFGSNPVHQDT